MNCRVSLNSGLSYIKNPPEEGKKNGKYQTLFDICRTRPHWIENKFSISSLVGK
jgi:hypothetical protein